jgi:hypothetical protein
MSEEEIADLLKIEDRAAFGRFLKELLESDNPVIVKALRHGIPSEFSCLLPESITVRCQNCGTITDRVPCVLCSQKVEEYMDDTVLHYRELRNMRPDLEEVPFKPPKYPTRKRPGSFDKLRIMTERVARGESPFHPKDATLEPV